jgi:BirA family biotin operon repressor/biotin-[acetyl-CoA-carboxylase] ligase
VNDVRPLLTTDALGRPLRGHAEVGSTNAEAVAWARAGAPHGGVVVAEYQTAGRGRQGRSWTATPGQNLMFSVVLRPSIPPNRLGLLPLSAGVAVADAVDRCIAPLRTALKWPNDVLIDDRKTCGLLLETSFAGTAVSGSPPGPPQRPEAAPAFVVLGVGLNVNQATFPDDLAGTATSLRLATGRLVPRAPLFAHLLDQLETRTRALATKAGAACVRAAFHGRMHRRGETATLRATTSGESIRGTVCGVTPTGALRLDTPSGMRTVYAGDVTSHPSR